MRANTDLSDPEIQRQVYRWIDDGVAIREIQRRLRCSPARYYRYFPHLSVRRDINNPPPQLDCIETIKKVERMYANGVTIEKIQRWLQIGGVKFRRYFGYLIQNKRQFERGWGKTSACRKLLLANPEITNKEILARTKVSSSRLRRIRRSVGIMSPERKARQASLEEHKKLVLRAIHQYPNVNGRELSEIVGITSSRARLWLQRYRDGEFRRYFDPRYGPTDWLDEPVEYAKVDDFVQEFWNANDCVGLQLTPDDYARYKKLFLLRRRGLQWSPKGIKKMGSHKAHIGIYKKGMR